MCHPESIVRKELSRVEGHDKVSGRARYAADHVFPELAYAVLVQSEIARGEVQRESLVRCTEQALHAPGVLQVLTPLNCPRLHTLPEDLTWDLPLERRPPLSDLTVQHVGQHLAIIVADTFEQATFAASLFDLRYDEQPPQRSAQQVLDSPVLPDEPGSQVRHGSYFPDHFVKLEEEKLQDRRGEYQVQPAFAKVSETYSTPINAHYPIELASAIAVWQGDKLELYDSTRWIAGERKALAAYLAMPEADIRILSPLVGGAFGSKSFLWMHVALTAVAAKQVCRPVKLVLTRDQMFSSTGHRPRTTQTVMLDADGDGLIESSEHHTLTETSTVGHFCEPAGLSTRILYHSPRLVVSHRTARINAPTPCFMRGPGESPGLFALEVAMDELACVVKVDPMELRVRNHTTIDQTNGREWSTKHLLECYRDGAQRFGWERRTATPRSMRRGNLRVGWGMATATYPGRRMGAGCRVRTDMTSGVVSFASATHEVGNGVRTVMTQVAMDTTGLAPGQVAFLSGDSDFPDAPYSGASQTTATVGSAVYQAASDWKQRVLSLFVGEKASPLFGRMEEEISLGQGKVNCGGVFSEDLWNLLRMMPAETLQATLNFEVKSDSGDQSTHAFQSFGAHFCEVEVEEDIGKVSVKRWTAVMDCGRVLNPKLARSQIMGGITFGLGMALLEQVPYDARTSLLIGEYYLPTHADRPDFDITFIDSPDYLLDPIGVRGIGEIGTCGVPAAIANAIFHATGRRLRSLPITLEQLMTPFDSQEVV